MSNESTIHDNEYLESGQLMLLTEGKPALRDPWRRICLVLRVCNNLISACNTKKASASASATEEDSSDSKLTGIVSSPQVSIDAPPTDNDKPDERKRNIERQHTNIAKIVKEKDLDSLHKFGGVQGIADAFDTDLEDGIPGNEEDLCSRRTASTIHDDEGHLESGQTEGKSALSDPWRRIYLVLRVHYNLISASNSKKASAAAATEEDSSVMATPYSVINTTTETETGHADSKLIGIVSSPQVSIDVPPVDNDETDERKGNIECQHTNIAKIVKEKDLDSLRKFGGVQGIADALDIDLENGIPDDEEDLCSRRTTSTIHNNEGNLGFGQIMLLTEGKSASRDPWRRICLVLRACNNLISACNTKKTSAAATEEDSSDLKLTGIVSSPQVSIDVPPIDNDEPDERKRNIERQHTNIAKIVKEKDLDSLHKFGGVQGIADALDTDLENGISGNEEDLCYRRTASTIHDDEGHLESGQTEGKSALRDPWRRIYLVLRVHYNLISASNSKKASAAAAATEEDSSVMATPYSVINTTTETETGHADSKLIGKVSSPQVSIDVPPVDNDETDERKRNIERQHTNIAKIVKEKDLDSLHKFGGVQGIADALYTDLENGIPGDEEDLCSRRMASTLSKTQAPRLGFFGFLLKHCNNYIIFLLLLSGGMSIGFGIKEEGKRSGWHEGVIIILAVIILVVLPALRDFYREYLQKFMGRQELSKNWEMVVDVIRGGDHQQISISEVVFGDIVCLKRGHPVPADGLFISGEFLDLDDGSESIINDQTPFMFYGEKVLDGYGRMLVTSVGVNTTWGEMTSRVTPTVEKTPLQAQLDKMSTCTQIIGLIISILMPLVLFLRFKLGKENHKSGIPELKGKPTPSKELMEAIKRLVMKPGGKLSNLTTSLTMLLVGVVEGVPFVVTLAIAYWNKKTLYCKALAQNLLACVTMGTITTICIDKTGGLTLNPMEVGECRIGEELVSEDSIIAPTVLEALRDGFSTMLLNPRNPCSSIYDALLSWAARKLGMKNKTMEVLKQSCTVVKATEVNSEDEESGVLMRKNGENEATMCLHWKGPAITILRMCAYYYDSRGVKRAMDENKRMIFKDQIESMESKDLKTIAFAYKQTDAPPVLEESDLILIGLLGLKCTHWTGVSKAVEDCRNADVDIKLVSEDSVSLLTTIAEKCGMLIPNSDAVMIDAEDFRKLTDEERLDIIDRIVVMGRSLPADRLLLVQCLRQKGHTVAVVGVTNAETPALKEANVGIAMGSWSTKVARESSDIIIWDGDFSFLVSTIRSGRCAYDNIRKYIQFQLTMTIAWLIISPSTTVALGNAPITAIQWFWAALILTIFGGMALLTMPPDKEQMVRPPTTATYPLISNIMWINIVTQALYQAAIVMVLVHKGQAILGINHKVCNSMIFNSFVLCQVFNQFNARELENKNVFKGLHQNYWFWAAIGFTLALQEAFTEMSTILVGSSRLTGKQWAICSLIGLASWAISWAVKWASDFSKKWFNGSTGMTRSASSESTSNLELPPINGKPIEIPS